MVRVRIRVAAAWIIAAVSLGCPPPAQAKGADGEIGKRSSGSPAAEKELEARLDQLTRAALSKGPFASISVAIMRGQQLVYRKAFGFAELNFHVPATPQTRYRLIGPGNALLSAAILRAAEQGKISLQDEASKYLPEFPWHGRRVTIRQLLDATSGLQDYHYLGDDYFRTARTPKRTDEVTSWFADRPFVHEPGQQWSWTISGYHLAGVILERVTGEPYEQYLQREVLNPSGLTGIVYCDGGPTPLLARGYVHASDGFDTDVVPTLTAVRFLDSYCGTAADVAMLSSALRRVLRPESFAALVTPKGAGWWSESSAKREGFAMGVHALQEEGRRLWGIRNNRLMGYSGSWVNFPDEDLTIVTLANTEVSTARVARNLARVVRGLPPLPSAEPPAAAVRSLLSPASQRAMMTGKYEGSLRNPTSPYRALRFTLCVYEEAGRLLGQFSGNLPFLLLKQRDGTFTGASARRFRFIPQGERIRQVDILRGDTVTAVAVRASDSCAT